MNPTHRTLLPIEITEACPSSSPSETRQGSSQGGPTLDFVSSDESLDRYDEVISAAGWRLETYQRNPVFQNAHNYGDIVFTLGRALVTEVRNVAGRKALFQRIEFATDVNPMARIAYGLYRGKFLNAVSVGFIPIRWQDGDGQADTARQGPSDGGPRRRYLEQELLEVSAVSIPANPNALALGLKSGALEKSDLRDLSDLLRSTLNPSSPPEPSATTIHLLHLAYNLRSLLKSI